MKYVAPIMEIEELNTEDVVLASNINISNEPGKLEDINWSELG